MLSYPAIQLECSLSDKDWKAKQQQVLTTSEWGGYIELQLMAFGLKRDILVITDSSVGSVFARKFPYQPPPVPKMKKGFLFQYHLMNFVAASNQHSYKIV